MSHIALNKFGFVTPSAMVLSKSGIYFLHHLNNLQKTTLKEIKGYQIFVVVVPFPCRDGDHLVPNSRMQYGSTHFKIRSRTLGLYDRAS